MLNAESPGGFRLDVLGRDEIGIDAMLRQNGWSNFVHVHGQCGYQKSLAAMGQADILVLFDSPGRKIGVPAKLYEYLGSGRPILALAEQDGDVAAILRESGVLHRIVRPTDAEQIDHALRELALAMRTTETVADASLLQRFTRRYLVQTFAARLDTLIGNPTIASARFDLSVQKWPHECRRPNREPTVRIVHVTGCLDMGGQEKLLLEFAKHADRDRVELRFVSLGWRGIFADELEALGWPVTASNRAGLHLRLPWKLAKLFRAWRADAVHTHNDRPLIYAAPAARIAGVSLVIHTKHGRGTGNSRRQNWLAALTARLTDRFVCVSQDCARQAVEQGVPGRALSRFITASTRRLLLSTVPRRTAPRSSWPGFALTRTSPRFWTR